MRQERFCIRSRSNHDSIAWDKIYEQITARLPQIEFVTMDAGYKTPWVAKRTLDDGKIPILPYTRHPYKEGQYKPWEYEYDPAADTFTCPHGGVLRHTTTDRNGKRTYRSTPSSCKDCPFKWKCGANEKGQKILTTHIWQEYLELVEQLRKTERGKEIYAMRKETIERVFADVKEKHAMRYTHHRGLARVTNWVRLKYAAMNLKKLANWSWNTPAFSRFLLHFFSFCNITPAFICQKQGFFDRLQALLKRAGLTLHLYTMEITVASFAAIRRRHAAHDNYFV